MTLIIALIIFVVIVAFSSVKVVNQASVKIIERLGKFHKLAQSGLNIIVPFIDKVRSTLDLREQLIDIDPQSVITRDNVTMQVDCVVYWQVIDPIKTVYEIFNVSIGIQQLTTSTIRSVIGEMDLDHTLSSREAINAKLRGVLDSATDKWGVKVIRVEVRNILPPEDIRVTMEKQMTAERNRRAVILTAEGEKQSAILTAEGNQQSAIISAEGEKRKRILEAEGVAEAKLRVAEAEAKAIEIVSKSLASTKADPASYLIALKYIESLKDISDNPNKMVFMPYEATGVLSSIATIKELFNQQS
ncbi:MAG: SPFH/Band 7/PHB domain protein [Ignavibacteria bacterium]|jgi:regulator of protease activity HflC (stomatin/prohibitin superfamily)|nr:SPFH/Band 7/PHB domain protein [Ignavibacteria bacterium]